MNDLDLLYDAIGDGFISGDVPEDYAENISEEEWKLCVDKRFQAELNKMLGPTPNIFGEY